MFIIFCYTNNIDIWAMKEDFYESENGINQRKITQYYQFI